MNKTKDWFAQPPVQHIGFWLIVYGCYCVSNWDDFDSAVGVFSTYAIRVGLQIVTAYVCLYGLLPYFLRSRNWLPTSLGLGLLVFGAHAVFTLAKAFYLEPTFPDGFQYCIDKFAGWTLTERIFNFRYAFMIMPVDLFPPTLVLVAIQYYRKQQQLSELNERQKRMELSALKQQLNPHFLFNTLNNIYTLALKKSDQTATAVGKLSDILDHILYRCNERFVPLSREVELLESYLALEQLRYGERVSVRMKKELPHAQTIAPLLLLTFLENAFKHGVSQETGRADIEISLKTEPTTIDFFIQNSIPSTSCPTGDRTAIGLTNIRRQLALLYPNCHQLDIEQTEQDFRLALKIHTP